MDFERSCRAAWRWSAEGFIRLTESDASVTSPVNLGNPGEFTMLELAEKVIRSTGSSSKIVFQNLPQDDPKQRGPDISLAKKNFHWEPTVALDQGLGWTVDYFTKLLSDMAHG